MTKEGGVNVSDNLRIEQNATIGTKTTQIGQQINVAGLTLSDALDFAHKLSESQYLIVKQELISTLNDRFKELISALNNKMTQDFEKRFEELFERLFEELCEERFEKRFKQRFEEELAKHIATDEEVEEMLKEVFGK